MNDATTWVIIIVSIFLGISAIGGVLMAIFYKAS